MSHAGLVDAFFCAVGRPQYSNCIIYPYLSLATHRNTAGGDHAFDYYCIGTCGAAVFTPSPNVIASSSPTSYMGADSTSDDDVPNVFDKQAVLDMYNQAR